MSDSHDWHDWIGRTRTSSEVLDPEPARRLQATLGRPMSIAVGDPLPPAWHWLYFHDVALAAVKGGVGNLSTKINTYLTAQTINTGF